MSDWLKFPGSYAHGLDLVWLPVPHVVEQLDHDPHWLKCILIFRYKMIKLTLVHLWLTFWPLQRHFRYFSFRNRKVRLHHVKRTGRTSVLNWRSLPSCPCLTKKNLLFLKNKKIYIYYFKNETYVDYSISHQRNGCPCIGWFNVNGLESDQFTLTDVLGVTHF